jgi:carbamoyltransferase
MIILGCNGGLDGYLPLFPTSRDAAAAIVVDGQVALAVEEARLSREIHTSQFPLRAIDACLRAAGLSSIDQVDRIAYSCRRIDAADVVLASGSRLPPAASFAIDAGLAIVRAATHRTGHFESASRLAFERALRARIPRRRFVCIPHALAHTANAFFTSPFDSALCLVSTSETHARSTVATVARGSTFDGVDDRFAPDSLGLLTGLVAKFLGFSPSEEPKLFALAALGDASRFRRFFALIVQTSVEGVAHVEPALLSLFAGRALFTGRGLAWRHRRRDAALVHALGPPRKPGEPIEARHRDIAAALAETVEHALLTSLEVLARRTGQRHLCLAGDVALNPSANGRIARSGIFERVHVAPAANDAGTSMGAALFVEHVLQAAPRDARRPPPPFLGPARDPVTIAETAPVESDGVRASRPDGLHAIVARALAAGKIVGWCEGRSEWGTQALGHRSILADPSSAATRDRLNASVKLREGYRPFSPAVLVERAHELFDLRGIDESPRMAFSVPVRASHRAQLAAVTHADGMARVQTVSRDDAPSLHALLEAFDALTGVPALLNTSLNVNDEPIVETPEDAIHFFLSSGIDVLVVDGVLFEKVPAARPEVVRRRVRARVARPSAVRLVVPALREESARSDAPPQGSETVAS